MEFKYALFNFIIIIYILIILFIYLYFFSFKQNYIENFSFHELPTANITLPNISITNIAAADFDRDGALDLLVQGKDKNGDQEILKIYFGQYTHFSKDITLNPPVGPVSIIDYNLDLKPDLIGNIMIDNELTRVVWINSEGDSFFEIVPFSPQGSNYPPIESSHSVSMVDFDGDCLSDLLIPSKYNNELYFEMWMLNSTSGKMKQHDTYGRIKSVPGQGQLTFADFDGDGNIDILFPVCDPYPSCSKENSIKIIFNQQKTVCGSIFEKNCRSSGSLCESDPDFKIEPFDTNESNDNVVIINKTAFGENTRFNALNDVPLIIRAGDYNLDRFPDILVPLVVDGKAKIQLWKNVPCTMKLCGTTKRRTFVPVREGTKELDNIEDTYTSTFFDIDEGGKNDIIVFQYDSSKMKYYSSALYNNFYNDAYFLKLLGLNGICTMCISGGEKKPYSVNQHGTIFKYTFTDLKGSQVSAIASQLPQSTHLSLYTPYTLNGLSRPASYVDYIFMGVTISTNGTSSSHYQSWPGIIPNSQVVISPYPPTESSNWVIELYISPSSSTVWIALAVCCWLLVIGAAILFLQYREKKQDEKEKKEKEHLFSFKAM